MIRKTPLIPLLFLVVVLILNPFTFSMNYAQAAAPIISQQETNLSIFLSPKEYAQAPPVPNGPRDWKDVSLLIQYFYNSSAKVAWHGEPISNQTSPYQSLWNWTVGGSIEGGYWSDNPGNATISVSTKTNFTEQAVVDFLNHTMEHYVRFTSWPSLNIFNFTEYVNGTNWVFEDSIISPVELLNTSFYFVNNATGYLMNGFNATTIAAAVTEWRVFMQWNETGSSLDFSYTIPNATQFENDTYTFQLSHAMGSTLPLTLNGSIVPSPVIRMQGPVDRMILDATPSDLYENTTFPYLPLGEEVFTLDEEERDFNLIYWFRQAIGDVSITREISSTDLLRGQVVSVIVTVSNGGDLPLSDITINDLGGILSGSFALVAGTASKYETALAVGENLTMEYEMIALQSGSPIVLPGATVTATDLLQNQYVRTSEEITLTVSSSLLPSETLLIIISATSIIIIIVILVLYRLRWRFR